MKKKKDRILIFATDFRLICETGYLDIRFGRIPKYSMRSAKSRNWPDYPVGQISSPFISNRALTMFIIVKILCYINYIMYCLVFMYEKDFFLQGYFVFGYFQADSPNVKH